MIDDYLVYIVLAVTITSIPGPAVLLTVKNSIRYGWKAAIINIFGNFTAMIILAALSAVGLGAVLISSSTLFFIMKISGCLYLIYLGVMSWRSEPQKLNGESVKEEIKRSALFSVFKEGFLVGITNPKAIAFFTALFPQFINPERSYIPQFMTLIFTIEGISFLILSTYALLASYASLYLLREKPLKIFNRLTAISFSGFGIALLFEKQV